MSFCDPLLKSLAPTKSFPFLLASNWFVFQADFGQALTKKGNFLREVEILKKAFDISVKEVVGGIVYVAAGSFHAILVILLLSFILLYFDLLASHLPF